MSYQYQNDKKVLNYTINLILNGSFNFHIRLHPVGG